MKGRGGLDLLTGLLVRLAGGRAAVVLPLARAMDRAARGQYALLRQRSGRRQRFSPEAVRWLMLALVCGASAFLALSMLIKPTGIHPPVGVILLVAFHWVLVLNLTAGQAGPALLSDEDHDVIGAWPVTPREIVLARLGTVLREAGEVSLAASAVPLAVYLVVGRPYVLPALLLAAGLVIQTIGLAFGVTTVAMAVVRLFGRQRAQRLAALVADGNFAMFGFFAIMFMDRIIAFIQAHPRVLLALPPAWFAAWGDPAAGPFYWLLAGLGLATTLAAVVTALRLLSPAMHDAAPARPAGRPAPWHPAHLLAAALRPMLPGREGWVVRRLLEAHLRDDWRFSAGLLVFPLLMAFMFFSRNPAQMARFNAADLGVTALTTVPYTHMLLIMAATFIVTMSFSSQPRALWLVVLGDLDHVRLMAAQRALIRGLITLPVLALYAVQALRVGTPPLVALRDVTLLLLQVEIIVMLLQPFMRTLPFSQPFTRNQTTERMLMYLLMVAVSIVFVAGNFAYTRFLPVRVAAWAGLPLLWLAVRRWSAARLARVRLNLDAVRGG